MRFLGLLWLGFLYLVNYCESEHGEKRERKGREGEEKKGGKKGGKKRRKLSDLAVALKFYALGVRGVRMAAARAAAIVAAAEPNAHALLTLLAMDDATFAAHPDSNKPWAAVLKIDEPEANRSREAAQGAAQPPGEAERRRGGQVAGLPGAPVPVPQEVPL